MLWQPKKSSTAALAFPAQKWPHLVPQEANNSLYIIDSKMDAVGIGPATCRLRVELESFL